MLEFSLSDDQRMIQDLARKFAWNEIIPVVQEYDQKHRVPLEILRKAHEAGFIHSHIPVEYGGGGKNSLDFCLIDGEMAYGCLGVATSLVNNNQALTPM